MRQLFQDRVSLTVYMERTDLEWLRATAKVAGEPVGEWSRQRLLYAAEKANSKPYPKVPARDVPYTADTPLPTFIPDVETESVVGPLPNPEKFPDGIEVCDHGAPKNKCQVMHCYFYFDPMGRATRGQYEAAKARRQAPLFEEPAREGEDEVHQSEDVRRDRDVPASGRRAAKAVRASRKTAKPKPKRGRRGDDEPSESRKCTAAVGPGIFCPKCSRRH